MDEAPPKTFLMNQHAPFSQDEANAVYDLLVAHCEEQDTADRRERFVETIVRRTTEKPDVYIDEYRFMGGLGFGGKFYYGRMGWYVSCYPEDSNDQRKAMLRAINPLLRAMYETHMKGGGKRAYA